MDNDSSDSEHSVDEVEQVAEDISESEKTDADVDDADVIGDESDDEKSELDDTEVVEEEEEPEPVEVAMAAATEYEFVSERNKNQIHKDVVVVDPKRRRTSNMISKTELVEGIGIRAQQIANKATVFVDISVDKKGGGGKTVIDDPTIMAKMEVAQRKFPLVLRRIVKTQVDKKTGKVTEWVEDWDVNEMIFPNSLKLQ